MTLNFKNQNDILNLEKLNSNEIEYIFSDKPINRLKTKPQLEDKIKLLSKLRSEIENIDNCELKKNKSKNSNIILDQSASYWRPTDYIKYFNNLKIIIINRDPRSIYYSMYSRNSKAYPSSNIITFAKWYKKIRNNQLKIKNKNVYIIQYEKFLNNFEIESKKLNNFLKISQKIKSKFDLNFSKNNILKAKNKLNKQDKIYLEKKLKNFLVW